MTITVTRLVRLVTRTGSDRRDGIHTRRTAMSVVVDIRGTEVYDIAEGTLRAVSVYGEAPGYFGLSREVELRLSSSHVGVGSQRRRANSRARARHGTKAPLTAHIPVIVS